jgi:parallel beta-helix repeat protein
MVRSSLVAAALLFSGSSMVLAAAQEPPQLPRLELSADNTLIDHSCLIVIKPGTIIRDAEGDGVLRIVKPGVTVAFEPGSILRGGDPATLLPNQYSGIGIMIDGVEDVRLVNAEISGFKVGVMAQKADRLRVEGASFDDLFRQRLKSTAAAEDSGDWLWPHANDAGEWRNNYGAALCILNSSSVTVHNVVVRRGQNGIMLDRVNDSRVYDNDCSFLSGWGISMWRSSRNIISRNACDFCVRGHSEGVYNRGQDSAGFLVFEQCSGNTFIENSATHGGDGFFGFAGKEAIGEAAPAAGTSVDYGKAGCNDNLLIDNDFSFASAHGIEMTFSRNNRYIHNRVVGNGICGIWGGYSSDSTIADNHFERNGDLAYGLERGAINIEHGSRNRIENNTFLNNRCGVHLWWDDDKGLLKMPGVIAAGGGKVESNLILRNRFEVTANNPMKDPAGGAKASFPSVQLRDSDGGSNVRGTLLLDNVYALNDPRALEIVRTDGITLAEPLAIEALYSSERAPIGERAPVGARARLSGREHIIMGEWGPWDHVDPMVVPRITNGWRHVYAVYGALPDEIEVTCDAKHSKVTGAGLPQHTLVVVEADQGQTVAGYTLSIKAAPMQFTTRGTLVSAQWECAAFSWS